jgi:hypothetical protein
MEAILANLLLPDNDVIKQVRAACYIRVVRLQHMYGNVEEKKCLEGNLPVQKEDWS